MTVPATRSTTRGVARQVSRVEVAKLVESVWFLFGAGFLGLFVLMFGVLYRDDNFSDWLQAHQIAPWLAHPFVGMVVFAAYRAARRPARDGASELFTTCPAKPVARTLGVLWTSWVPIAGISVMLVTLDVLYVVQADGFAPLSRRAVPLMLGAMALGAGGVALGVALAEWVPFVLAPLIAVAAVGAATLTINNAGDPNWNAYTQLSTAPAVPDFGPVFVRTPDWWHLLWIVALVVIVAALAVLRHDRSRRVFSIMGIGLVVAAIAAFGSLRPIPGADADTIATRIADPGAHTRCAQARPVRVCTFAGFDDQRKRFIDQIKPVAKLLPAHTEAIVVRHTFDGTYAQLPPEIRRRLPNGIPPLGDREIALPFGSPSSKTEAAPFVVALVAVGLPTRARALMPLAIDGKARGVVALWLATRGMTADDAVRYLTPSGGQEGDEFESGSLAVGDCEVPPVVWSQQDLAAARTIARLPERQVRPVVLQNWSRWIDPATSTDELLVALGQNPSGAYDDVQPRPGNPC